MRCAIDIQDANNAKNIEIAESERLLFRIGIAIGDVLVSEDGDLLGDAVNIAARLENLAEPGGICISDEVRAHVLNKIRLNVIDLGNQNLRNIPRAIRAFKVVSRFRIAPAPRRNLRRKIAALRRISWLGSAIVVLGLMTLGAFAWQLYSSARDLRLAATERPFDPATIPLVADRVRETLSNYEREPEFKAIAISREGWGLAVGAVDVEFAKREALDRCQQRDQKGYCRIYAISNKVFWSKGLLPLASDVRAQPLEPPLRPDDAKSVNWAIGAQPFDAYLKGKDHKALAITQDGFWSTTGRPTQAEAARLAIERCSDRYQMPCLLLSVDGFPTLRLPSSYHISGPFTLAGENDLTDADRERIAQTYAGLD